MNKPDLDFKFPQENIIKTPGKVSAKTIVINLGKSAPVNNSVKIAKRKRVKIQKDSSQLIKEYYTLNYIIPYVDPDFIRDMYESNPYHLRCIKFKSNCIIGSGSDIIPIKAGEKINTEDKEYKLINDFINNPINVYNEYWTQVWRAFCDDYVNYGHAFMEVVVNNNNQISELYNFPAYAARISYDPNTEGKWTDKVKILQLTNLSYAKSFPLLTEDSLKTPGSYIFWHKNSNPFSRFYGFPEWYSATPKLVLEKAIDEYNIRSFKNDLLISFVIIVEGGDIDNEGLGKVTEFLSANYKGLVNANRALYLNSDSTDVKIRIERVQKEGREASFLQTQIQNRDAITVAHGVVGSLLGISTPGKLGASQENYDLFRVFNYTIIKPEQLILQAKLNNLLKIGLGIKNYKIELKELTFEKLSESIDYATRLTQSGIIDTNEARQYLDYEPKELDTLESQINQIAKEVRIIKSQIE